MSQKNIIYVWAGQSWVSGREPYASLPAKWEGYRYNYRVWNGTGFEVMLRNAGNNHFGDSTTGEWGMEFPMTEFADDLGSDIYVLKYGIGGTQLAQQAGNDWNASSVGEYTDNLVGYIQGAKDWMDARNKSYEFRGIFWFQGERDSQDLAEANAYGTNMQAWYDKIRAAIGFTIPIYHYYVNNFVPAYIYIDELNGNTVIPATQGKAKFHDDNQPYSFIVSVDDVTNTTDSVHPDANGNQQLWDKNENRVISDLDLILPAYVLPVDPDVQAFIDEYTVTDQTFIDAIDDFWTTLKTNGITTKINTFRPVCTENLASSIGDLVNPGVNDMVVVGGVSHSSTGLTQDGSTGYLREGLTGADFTQDSSQISIYTSGGAALLRNGGILSTTSRLALYASGVSIVSDHYRTTLGGRILVNVATNFDGLLSSTRVSTTDHRVFRDGIQIGSTNANATVGTVAGVPELHWGSFNNNGTPSIGGARTYKLMVTFNTALTPAEEAIFAAANLTYQTALGREN